MRLNVSKRQSGIASRGQGTECPRHKLLTGKIRKTTEKSGRQRKEKDKEKREKQGKERRK